MVSDYSGTGGGSKMSSLFPAGGQSWFVGSGSRWVFSGTQPGGEGYPADTGEFDYPVNVERADPVGDEDIHMYERGCPGADEYEQQGEAGERTPVSPP